MKILNHLHLALVLLLLTDVATFDLRHGRSKIFTEGTYFSRKCNLLKCATGEDEPPTKRAECPIKLASCGQQASCGGGNKNACSVSSQSNECPFCGRDVCPQQKPASCGSQKPPPPKPGGCPSAKGGGCPAAKSGSCPHPKPSSCPAQKPQSCPLKNKCPASGKPKCPPPAKPKCPQQGSKPQCPAKPSCPHHQPHNDKPSCPNRCSMFKKFSFPAVMNLQKYTAPVATSVAGEHKPGKCGPSCPGSATCKIKPTK